MNITARVEPPELRVSQEGLAGAVLHLRNDGDKPTRLQVDVTGPAAGWSWVTPASLILPAGESTEVKVTFKAPRSPLPPAGPLPVELRLAGPAGTDVPVVVGATLEVAAYTDVFATMTPPVSSGTRQGHHTLTVANRGNATVEVSLAAHTGAGTGGGSPPTQGTGVEIEPKKLSIAPGTSASAVVTARAPEALLRGDPRDYPVRVQVLVDGVPATTVSTLLRQQPAARGWMPKAAVAVVGVGVMAALSWATVFAPDDGAGSSVEEHESAVAIDRECPARDRLGGITHGQPEALGATGYAFLYADENGCRPIRFPACEPLHYVLNDALAPPGAVEDVHAAVGRVADATGITFVYDGPTDEPVDVRRSAYQPERYGQRWAPILIGWSALGAGSGPDAAGDDIIVAGRGNPIRIADSLVSGVLELNADVILNRNTQERLPGGFGDGITRGRVLLHEFGHVMGLGHVASRAQLMYPELAEHTSSTAEFGVGDRVGLRLVGREAGCLEAPPLPD